MENTREKDKRIKARAQRAKKMAAKNMWTKQQKMIEQEARFKEKLGAQETQEQRSADDRDGCELEFSDDELDSSEIRTRAWVYEMRALAALGQLERVS